MNNSAIGMLCSSAAWGGLEMNVLRLSCWLQEKGWKIIIYGQEGSPLLTKAKISGIETVNHKSNFKYGDIINAYSLTNKIQQDNVHILILHERKDLMLGAITKFGVGRSLKLIYQQHMHIGVDKRDFYHTWLYSNLDAWVVPLDILKNRLLQKTKFDAGKVAVIPFGIELDKFTDHLPDKVNSRNKLEVPPDAVIVGVVGRLDPEKNQETLIKACAELHRRNKKIHVLLVGDETLNEGTTYKAYLQKLTADLKISNHVHYRPFMPEINDAYAAMDIFVLTTRSETYGMVTIEAMASGLPVIGTCHGGTREIINHEVNGLHIEREDPNEMADAIERIINNPQLSQSLTKQARLDAINKYSHFVQIKQFEKLFINLQQNN